MLPVLAMIVGFMPNYVHRPCVFTIRVFFEFLLPCRHCFPTRLLLFPLLAPLICVFRLAWSACMMVIPALPVWERAGSWILALPRLILPIWFGYRFIDQPFRAIGKHARAMFRRWHDDAGIGETGLERQSGELPGRAWRPRRCRRPVGGTIIGNGDMPEHAHVSRRTISAGSITRRPSS